jgi:hypothetical protein
MITSELTITRYVLRQLAQIYRGRKVIAQAPPSSRMLRATCGRQEQQCAVMLTRPSLASQLTGDHFWRDCVVVDIRYGGDGGGVHPNSRASHSSLSPDALTFEDISSILSSQTNDPPPPSPLPSPSKPKHSSDALTQAGANRTPDHLDPISGQTAAADYGMLCSIGSSSSTSSSLAAFLLGSGGDDPTARVLIFLLPDNPSPSPALAQAAWMMRGVVRAVAADAVCVR